MTSEARTDLIVNDNPYLAVEINADGCHIGQDDMPPAIARSILGPERILGLSTHSAEQALAAQLEPIDYIGVGPVYATTTKQSGNMPVGPALVQWARQTISYPLVAIGGISGETIAEVVNAGAHNVAIIGDIIRGPDMAGRAAQFRAMIDDALASRRARLEANIGRGL